MANGETRVSPLVGNQPSQQQIGTGTQPVPSSRFVLRRATSPDDWNRAILSTGRAGLLQSWQWGKFKRESGWKPLRMVLQEGDDQRDGTRTQGRPLVAAQVLFRSIPRLPLPISIGYIPRGPVFFPHDEPAEKAEATFWQAVHNEARRRGAIFLKVEPEAAPGGQASKEDVDRRMEGFGFRPAGRLQPARTIVLDLERSEDDLLKAMKGKTRYNLRLASRRGVTVRRAATVGDLQAFYTLLQVTGERDEFGVHTFPYYERLWEIFGPQGDDSLLVLLAEHPDEGERSEGPIAGLLALNFGREAVYMYGASSNKGREHMPNYLLQWEAIKWSREQGCAIYDFWGIPDPPSSEEGEEEVSPINSRAGLRGVYWFKMGFGGREIDYPGAYDYIYNPYLYRAWMQWRGADLG